MHLPQNFLVKLECLDNKIQIIFTQTHKSGEILKIPSYPKQRIIRTPTLDNQIQIHSPFIQFYFEWQITEKTVANLPSYHLTCKPSD